MYCSLILPYLTYCVEVWGNTYKTILQPIFILQKKAIRIINKTEYLAATNPLFIHNNTLKLEDIVKFNTATFMYKINNNLLPPSIQELFQTRESQYNLRGTCVLKQKLVRTNTKARCLSIKGVDVWNSLENDLKLSTSITTFKKLLKMRVINRYKTLL